MLPLKNKTKTIKDVRGSYQNIYLYGNIRSIIALFAPDMPLTLKQIEDLTVPPLNTSITHLHYQERDIKIE